MGSEMCIRDRHLLMHARVAREFTNKDQNVGPALELGFYVFLPLRTVGINVNYINLKAIHKRRSDLSTRWSEYPCLFTGFYSENHYRVMNERFSTTFDEILGRLA